MFAMAVPCSGGIEITQNGVMQAVDAVKPVEHDFGLEFGLAVGICWTFGSGFGNWNGVGNAEDGAAGRKNKFLHTVREAGFEKRGRWRSIGAETSFGVEH